MMEYWVSIDGIKYNLVPGVTHLERLDDELDTAKVIIRRLSISKPFKPYTFAVLKLGDFKRKYCIMNDEVLRISATKRLYTHTLNLVSQEKILDLDVLPNLAFSNDLINGVETRKTVREQIERLMKIYPTRKLGDIKNGRNLPFIITNIGNSFLDERTNQVFLGGKSVLGCLKAITQRTKMIPYVNERTPAFPNEISFKNLNGFGKDYTKEYLEQNKDFVAYNSNQDANYFCNFIKSSIDNGITDNLLEYPFKDQFITCRSGSGSILKENNCKLILPLPIEYIDRVFIKINRFYKIGEEPDTTTAEGVVYVDVTKFFNEKDIYATLEIPSSGGDYSKIHQGNSFYFSKGNNEIMLNGESKIFGFDITKIEYFLQSLSSEKINVNAYNENGEKVTLLSGTTLKPVAKWDTILWNVRYKPLDNALVRAYKQEKEDVNASFSANFSENRIEVDRAIDNISTMANRIGNEEITLERHLKNGDEETKINDFIKLDGTTYKCVLSETAQFQNYKKNLSLFSKNFAHVSNYVGVDTQYRQYQIPREGVKRNIEYDDFIFFSVDDPLDKKKYPTYFDINNLAYSFENISDKLKYKIDTCVWTGYKLNMEDLSLEVVSGFIGRGETALTKSSVLTPVRSEGSKNTAIFDFGFSDTIVASNSIYKEKDVGYNVPVYYCGKDGKMDCLNFSLGIMQKPEVDTIDENISIANRYPIKINANKIDEYFTKNSLGNDEALLYIDKDIAEILSMTYQIHFLPENHNDICVNNIGEFFPFVGNTTNNLCINERATLEDDFTCFDDMIEYGKKITPISVKLTSFINDNDLKYVRIDLGKVYNKFALVDGTTRKILFACNKPTQYIYAYCSHKR